MSFDILKARVHRNCRDGDHGRRKNEGFVRKSPKLGVNERIGVDKNEKMAQMTRNFSLVLKMAKDVDGVAGVELR